MMKILTIGLTMFLISCGGSSSTEPQLPVGAVFISCVDLKNDDTNCNNMANDGQMLDFGELSGNGIRVSAVVSNDTNEAFSGLARFVLDCGGALFLGASVAVQSRDAETVRLHTNMPFPGCNGIATFTLLDSDGEEVDRVVGGFRIS